MAEHKSPFTLTSIGEIRGFFDLLLPGVFILLHLALVLYAIGTVAMRDALAELSLRPAFTFVIIVPTGYLIGLALRMTRTGYADRRSAEFPIQFRPLR